MAWDMKCTIFALVIAIIVIICLILIYNIYKINKVVPTIVERGTIASIAHSGSSGSMHFGLGETIIFTKTFASIPQVYFSVDYSSDGYVSASATTLTKLGFTPIVFASAVGTTSNLHWIAVGW